ncbi:hypothetical protein POM88_046107 [Heracleum sosnowskyi]|uniref:Secretory carrier-associated membrane protein n=1 Tax=Heracleum sosnowskyi TaxID=360622 RepID=A0AAD8H8M1_9APIA|nr:hypothetical protein POM88_046107 [Heracleum sosnowskyi]
MKYGKVDSNTNSLNFPLSRPCNAGEQCFLSYGKLSISHLITFYGFSTQGDNPYDVVPIDLDLPDIDDSENGSLMSDWTSHMVRGTWLSKNHEIFHYGLPSPLLDHFRRAQGCTVQPKTIIVRRKEEAAARAGIVLEEKNWPPFFPIIHHDIANEIPIHLQKLHNNTISVEEIKCMQGMLLRQQNFVEGGFLLRRLNVY